jgi:hypothetical protein
VARRAAGRRGRVKETLYVPDLQPLTPAAARGLNAVRLGYSGMWTVCPDCRQFSPNCMCAPAAKPPLWRRLLRRT